MTTKTAATKKATGTTPVAHTQAPELSRSSLMPSKFARNITEEDAKRYTPITTYDTGVVKGAQFGFPYMTIKKDEGVFFCEFVQDYMGWSRDENMTELFIRSDQPLNPNSLIFSITDASGLPDSREAFRIDEVEEDEMHTIGTFHAGLANHLLKSLGFADRDEVSFMVSNLHVWEEEIPSPYTDEKMFRRWNQVFADQPISFPADFKGF